MNDKNQTDNPMEKRFGVVIAIFAAFLAVTDLGAGKFGDDEIIAHNEKSNAYQWYQAKDVKKSLKDGERAMLESLVAADIIKDASKEALQKRIAALKNDVTKYDKEKKEILIGSKAVGESSWAQEDKEGKLGNITGAREYQILAEKLGGAGDIFDFATLFLQITLVIGAIGLMLQEVKLKNNFFNLMMLLGVIGSSLSVWAFYIALRI